MSVPNTPTLLVPEDRDHDFVKVLDFGIAKASGALPAVEDQPQDVACRRVAELRDISCSPGPRANLKSR